MTDELRDTIGRAAQRHEPPAEWFEKIERRFARRRRNRRIVAGTVGVGLSLAVFVPLALQLTAPLERSNGGAGFDAVTTCGLASSPTAVWRWEGSADDELAGRHAQLFGEAGFYPGIAGEALTLDGDGDFASVPDDPALNVGTGDFTIAVWVRYHSTSGRQILVEDWIETFEPETSLGWTLTKLKADRFGMALGATGVVETPELQIRAEEWIHVAASRQGDRVSIFVDGEVAAAAELRDPARSLDSPAALSFGHRGVQADTPRSLDRGGLYLDGQLDEAVFVVGRSLSDDEIRTLAERPDACAPDLPNIALGMPATASKVRVGSPPSAAVDGSSISIWNSGYAPQWIEIDLGAPRSIGRIELLTTQLPDGETIHRVLGRATESEPFRLLHEFAGSTANAEWLEHAPSSPWRDIRFIRIESTESPSWIGWREINVYPAP